VNRAHPAASVREWRWSGSPFSSPSQTEMKVEMDRQPELLGQRFHRGRDFLPLRGLGGRGVDRLGSRRPALASLEPHLALPPVEGGPEGPPDDGRSHHARLPGGHRPAEQPHEDLLRDVLRGRPVAQNLEGDVEDECTVLVDQLAKALEVFSRDFSAFCGEVSD